MYNTSKRKKFPYDVCVLTSMSSVASEVQMNFCFEKQKGPKFGPQGIVFSVYKVLLTVQSQSEVIKCI